ncbi:HAD hydrolase family protein [Saccharothrix longispora]|uniref:Cof subfamily protein (Haloacid dehalogenase superfamily) n=1 Tax=Saccharothrix longispora TaxID=33920 RepID=A0ABU1Q3T7_9PSEU|nr:HAD family hydrolase [Saccharothrix longispora]MDR6597528.1 Cof subfamily protein (haloacid dehalogenase superfamily) [Saccharothrix longispora]
MQRPSLVASDVDGTLLTPLGGVSPRTAATVGRVLAEGVPFVLSTGRPPRWVPVVADAAGLTGYAVCSNGAVLYDIGADRVVSAELLTPVQLTDLAAVLDEALPGCSMASERLGGSARDPDRAEFIADERYLHPWEEGAQPLPGHQRAQLLGKPAVKLLVRHPGMTSDEMARAAGPLVGDSVAMTWSTDEGLLEFAAPGVTKATGLAAVADRLGVAAADVLAFGDMPNDVPMLRWAGHGVAMANGHADALAVADEVTASSAEDGVAQVLERWF